MQLNIYIEDSNLQKKLIDYISKKHVEANDLIVELLQNFFHKDKNMLNYKTKNPDLSASTLDFGLKEKGGKLFQDVDDVQEYAKKLRINAWK